MAGIIKLIGKVLEYGMFDVGKENGSIRLLL